MKPFAYATATFDLLMGCLCCVGLTYGLASDLETLEALYMVPVLSVMIAWTVIFFKSDCSMYVDLNLDIKVYFICYWIFFGLSAISSFIGYSFAKGSTTIHLKSKSRTQLQTDATLNVDHNL
ncbi:AbcC3 [Acrasis kona]|uniref:AbcC3 n=1 Tax=Acrasis kona TaxID=1008807 RepID=A0AAW2ZEG0_9EUKA